MRRGTAKGRHPRPRRLRSRRCRLHFDDVVAERGGGTRVVADHHDGEAVSGKAADEVLDGGLADGVEGGCGFVEKKGLHVLEIMARMRSDVLFVFAGHGTLDPRGWGMPNVRVYSGLFGSTLASLYRASDLLLLPSTGEGFPLVVQEALACGLAILCGTDTAGADSRAEAFLKGVAVDLAKPERSARLFCEEMTRVLARPAKDADRRAPALR